MLSVCPAGTLLIKKYFITEQGVHVLVSVADAGRRSV